MRLLVLDCAANVCAAAVLENTRVLAAISEPMTRGHAERIAPMLGECLSDAGVAVETLDAVAVTIGPGAFTGIRIGLAAARGLALAAGIPVLGINCLEVAAAPFKGHSPVLVALETKRADFYLQAFDAEGNALTKPAALPLADLPGYLPQTDAGSSWLVAGDGAERLVGEASETLPELRHTQERPENNAVAAGILALARFSSADLPSAEDPGPRPLYLRPPDVNLKPAVSPLTDRPNTGGNADHDG